MPLVTDARLLGLLAGLYFAQGLPSGLIAKALPVLLREHEVSLSAIGFTRRRSLLARHCFRQGGRWCERKIEAHLMSLGRDMMPVRNSVFGRWL